jgi:hypothetical protein
VSRVVCDNIDTGVDLIDDRRVGGNQRRQQIPSTRRWSVGNMPARPSVAELNATYDEPRSVMTNLVGLASSPLVRVWAA